MNFSIDDITKTWSEIELKKYKGKYQKSIYTNAKIKINASVIFDQNLRSVDFTFDTNKISEKKINFNETKGIKVDILQHQDFPNLIIICIYLKNSKTSYFFLYGFLCFIIDISFSFNNISVPT